jgi:hypothetical protein
LLCTFHHTLLHEGGFKIRRDHENELYFQRPDGRVIPRFGSRLDDMQDDYAVAENPSMEGPSTHEHRWVDANPSTEVCAPLKVREAAAACCIGDTAPYQWLGREDRCGERHRAH